MSIKNGYFIFKNVGDGCLVSKYCNDTLESPLTECSKLVSGNILNDPFIGIYRSTWIETGYALTNLADTTDQTLLKIELKHIGIYKLTWYEGAKVCFTGEAMVYENVLVGSYT
jgi:hypothetical protein